MDEKTTAQDIEQGAFDFEDEVFDFAAASAEQAAEEMVQKQNEEDKSRFRDLEGFANIFPDNWTLIPPEDPKEIQTIVNRQIAKKAGRLA